MVSVSVNGSYTWQFALGQVPFFVTLSACVSVGVGYTRESTHETIKLSDGTTAIDTDQAISVTNNALAINFGIMFRVSAGAGISGVCSLGVSATIAFNPSLIFYETGWEEKPAPHKILPLNLSFELVAQLLFFKVSVTILQYKTSTDNWEDEAVYELQGEDVWRVMEPRFELTHPGENGKRHTLTMLSDGRILAGDGGDPFASMIPVDQETITYSLEAKGLQRSSTSNEEYIATAYMDKLPCLVMRDDGGYDVKLVDAPGHHAFAFGDVDVEGQAPTQDGPAAMFSAERLNEEVRAANGVDPYRDEFFGLGKLVAEEYDYDYADYQKTTRNVCEEPGVRDIAPNDGIQPSADIPIFEGVFSDARIKVVEIAGVMYQFRISTIEYGQEESIIGRRGRLTASRFNADERIWEDPVVLEYSTGDPDLSSDLHHMMACYLVDGKLCEDFVICDLDHPVDQFAVAGVDFAGASVFTTLEITDADKSIGTVRYLAIPYVAALEVKAFTPSDDFIIAGTKGHFQLDIFNHGNIIITGFTATMHDKESGTDLTYVVDTIEPSNIRINSSNGKWAESVKLGPSTMDGGNSPAQVTTLGLSDEAANGWLMPGSCLAS